MKALLVILILTIGQQIFSQQTNPSSLLTKLDYLKKSKKQKKAASILCAGGLGISLIGLGMTLDNYKHLFNPNSPGNNSTTADILGNSGIIIMAGSIPLFIAAKKNKKKAMSMSLKNQMIPQLQNSSFVYRAIPSINLKIGL